MSLGFRRLGKYATGASPPTTAARHATTIPLGEPLLPNKKSGFTEDSLSSVSGGDAWGDDDEGRSSSSSDSEHLLLPKLRREDVVPTVATSLFVACGLAASVYAMIAVPDLVVFAMGICLKANLLLVARNRFRIARCDGVRTSVNNVQREIVLLKEEIGFLEHSVEDLQAETDVLIGFERELSYMANAQGWSVTEIADLVDENERNLNEMRANLRRSFVTAMVTVVVESEKDANTSKIASKELPLLGLRLQIQLEKYGINLDTNKFEAMIREDNDVRNVLRFCFDMLFEEEPTTARGGDDDSVRSELTFDFDSLRKPPKGDAPDTSLKKMTHEEKASMATVDDRLCKGSVEVARGRRMTLLPSAGSGSGRDATTRKRTIVKEVERRQSRLVDRRRENLAATSSKRRAPGDANQSPVSSLEW